MTAEPRHRNERREILLRLERERAGPPPFRVRLAVAKAQWPEWDAAHRDRRAEGLRGASEKYDLLSLSWPTSICRNFLPSVDVVSHRRGCRRAWIQHRYLGPRPTCRIATRPPSRHLRTEPGLGYRFLADAD
jgi:hypothetical protein